MAKQNRSTLRNYFRSGAMPTAEHFGHLIDSSLNTLEEGFDKTAEQGFKVSALEDKANLISFYRDGEPDAPLWSISYDQQIDSLLFRKKSSINPDNHSVNEENEHTVLSMTQDNFVGINNSKPTQALDVAGVVKSDGRMGSTLGLNENIPADGKWHNISPLLEGCQAFEVVAGVGIKGTGRYALLLAKAINTCNPTGFFFNFFNWKNPIKCQHAYYNSPADKLKLRWVAADKDANSSKTYRPYYLQIRTNGNYGEGLFIRYHISQLWFDNYMQDSQIPSDEPL